MARLFKFVLGMLLLYFILGREGSEIRKLASELMSNLGSQVQLSEFEVEALRVVLHEEASVLLLRRDNQDSTLSVLNDRYVHTTARTIRKAYSKNEAKGDYKFKGKPIFLTGIVKSVNSGVGDKPFIVFDTGSTFNDTQAKFRKGYDHLAIGLNKRDLVNYVCIGAGSILGSPMLRDCIPVEEARIEFVDRMVKEVRVNNKLRGDVNVELLYLSALSKSSARFIDKNVELNLDVYKEILNENGDAIFDGFIVEIKKISKVLLDKGMLSKVINESNFKDGVEVNLINNYLLFDLDFLEDYLKKDLSNAQKKEINDQITLIADKEGVNPEALRRK